MIKSFFVATMLALGSIASTAASAADAPAAAPSVRVFIHHEVADYAAWRKVYDAFHATQKKMGVTKEAVYQTVGNPNDVIITHDFPSAEQAKAFLASDELKNAMQKAGVKGPPQVWVTTKTAK